MAVEQLPADLCFSQRWRYSIRKDLVFKRKNFGRTFSCRHASTSPLSTFHMPPVPSRALPPPRAWGPRDARAGPGATNADAVDKVYRRRLRLRLDSRVVGAWSDPTDTSQATEAAAASAACAPVPVPVPGRCGDDSPGPLPSNEPPVDDGDFRRTVVVVTPAVEAESPPAEAAGTQSSDGGDSDGCCCHNRALTTSDRDCGGPSLSIRTRTKGNRRCSSISPGPGEDRLRSAAPRKAPALLPLAAAAAAAPAPPAATVSLIPDRISEGSPAAASAAARNREAPPAATLDQKMPEHVPALKSNLEIRCGCGYGYDCGFEYGCVYGCAYGWKGCPALSKSKATRRTTARRCWYRDGDERIATRSAAVELRVESGSGVKTPYTLMYDGCDSA
ncbi:hypothetical protein VOLCADRAFT_98838 [Volvox carteri f. nagariensis]|uniref:Uncharacterized protein n=1 Tax=Volvox carteri f. nagariensis TaxID=3068 RepID=D8UGE7_VOLCA|nr:uncharacterized protein VOLCADRAFT_98838 [Volvox carteri f. nagariensis]EFJ41163.1 hypothetical protein VOLCADRAFT_98838 [Volvox carteri f. nagariensis]|eukprot:XP_002957731.1 hypothetical protein VOLCADRAFT_98838 [Volvox carteri f. nagariensis]